MSEEIGQNPSHKSAVRIVLVDGLLRSGGPFALLMLLGVPIIGSLFGDRISWAEYLSSSGTWWKTIFYFLFFGLVMGIYYWVGHKGRKVDKYKVT